MKLVILLLMSLILSCQGQNKTNQKSKTNIQEDTIMINQDSVQIEHYDFNITENGTRSLAYERGDGWLVEWWAMKDSSYGACKEYAPANDFYVIYKEYHLNGMIKERGKFMPVAFGKREYFDEKGNCIKIVDEDKKFGAIKPEDIIQLLEKEGWFNRQTGENVIMENSILPTNYKFYREIRQYMDITFKRAVIDKQGKEIEPPKWFIEIDPPSNMYHITRYVIDGNTGEFEKKETFEPLEI